MTSTAAFEMAMVHRFSRNELHGVPELINGVRAGDAKRAAVVNAHLSFIVAVLHHLKGLRNTSVSLMLAAGTPVHIVAAWHGHDPAVSLSIYSHAQLDDLRAAGASLFG